MQNIIKAILLSAVLATFALATEAEAITFDKNGISGLNTIKLSQSLTLGNWNTLQNLADDSGGKIIPGISYEGFGITTNAWYDKTAGVWKSLGKGHAGGFIMESGSAWLVYASPVPTAANEVINWQISTKWYSHPTGNVGIGKKFDATDKGPGNVLDGEPEEDLHIAGGGNNAARLLIQTDSDEKEAAIWLRRGRGQTGAPTTVSKGDVIGQIRAFAWSGEGSSNNYHQGAAINWEIDDQDFSIGQRPGSRLSFYTNERGNSDYARLVIKADGKVGIGTTDPKEKLEVDGGIRLNATTGRPACSSDTRGTMWFIKGDSGVADSVMVCAKDAADAYDWRKIY
jgi:hypothetical protein